MESPKHSHNHEIQSSSPNDCDNRADLSTDEDEADLSLDLHPQYLSKQSRRAFLASAGAAAALSTNYAMGFLRGSEEAKAETLLAADSIKNAGNIHVLKATPQTCFWGFFDKTLPPVLTINSGDIVYIEALTDHAGDAPDLLIGKTRERENPIIQKADERRPMRDFNRL